MSGTRKEVAEAILALSYVEMTDLADEFVASVKSDAEDGQTFDPTERIQVAERLRWWAEGYLDSTEEESTNDN